MGFSAAIFFCCRCLCTCRMLGFSSAFGAGTVSSDFIGSGPIWMDNVQCEGREWLYSSLEACTSRGWGVANCNHNQDATVTCDSECMGSPLRRLNQMRNRR